MGFFLRRLVEFRGGLVRGEWMEGERLCSFCFSSVSNIAKIRYRGVLNLNRSNFVDDLC